MKEGLEKEVAKKENSLTKENRDPLTIDNGKKKSKEERPATKVVVRRLPPSMTRESFIDQVSPMPVTDYMYFVQADTSLTPHCFSRAYINFTNQEDLFIFTQKFDNYVFVDSKGQEYAALVEFAPFQRIPKHRPNRRKDLKMGTLDADPIYISFKEKLEAEMLENKLAANAVKQHFFETSAVTNEKKEVTTPLLDFIKNRRVERQRIRDEKREEKRKKDLERRRAKDEQRKTKKDDESPAVKPKDHKANVTKENSNLPNVNVPTSAEILSVSQNDNKKPLFCDQKNIPKSTAFSVSSLQKCLLEFQKNILITTQLNKMNNTKLNLCSDDKTVLKHNDGTVLQSSNCEENFKKFCDVGVHSKQESVVKPNWNENIETESKASGITYCIGSSNSARAIEVDTKLQQLMQVSVIKNPLNYSVQCTKNGFSENIRFNTLNADRIQIMRPLRRFDQKGVGKTPVLTTPENKKIYSNNFCNNLHKIVENVLKKTPEENNSFTNNKECLNNANADLKNIVAVNDAKHDIVEFKKNEFRKVSKIVQLQSPRPIKSLPSKNSSSFALNGKYLEPFKTTHFGENLSVVNSSKSDRSFGYKSDPLLPTPFGNNLQTNFENEKTVAKIWHQGTRTYPRRPHSHTTKTYFQMSKKAKT